MAEQKQTKSIFIRLALFSNSLIPLSLSFLFLILVLSLLIALPSPYPHIPDVGVDPKP